MSSLLRSVQIFPDLKGAHNSELSYKKFDEVQHQTSIYVAAEDIPAGTEITDPRWVVKLDNSAAYAAEQAREEAEALRVEAEAARMGFKPMGAYNPANENKYGEWYTHEGGSYGYIWPEPSTGVPVTDTSHWQQIASIGGQDLVDAAVAARDAAQAQAVLAQGYAAQLAAGTASPAGTYANLAALISADPDHSKIYITLDDGNWCYWNGAAFVAGGVYQTTSSPNTYSPFRNLLDTSTLEHGYYMTADGSKIALATLALTDYISVSEGDTLVVTYDNGSSRVDGHIRFLCAFNASKTVVAAAGVDNERSSYIVPSGIAFVKVTVRETQMSGIMLSLDINKTLYTPFVRDFSKHNYKINSKLFPDSIITVDANGNGDYLTVNDAIDAADDSAANPVTIIINPGVYVESLRLVERYITLIGMDRETCIIKTFTNDYLAPPLDLWCGSAVVNLTFYADADGNTNPEGIGNGRAYGIHIDQNSLYKARIDAAGDVSKLEGVVRVENCHVISTYANGIGAGTCPNCTIIIKDCEIETIVKDNDGFMGGFRIHNYPYTGTGQKAFIDNCIIHNPWLTPPVMIQDTNHNGGTADNFDTVYTFRNNITYNDDAGLAGTINVNAPHDATCISNYILHGISSVNNSHAALNY